MASSARHDTSRPGPSSSLAAVAGGAVLLTGLGGTNAAQLVAAIAVLTGALFLLVAALKLGWLASFLSLAVVTGFLAGAAIDVVIGELPKITGTSADGVNAWQELASWVRGFGDLSLATLVVGVLALAVILGLRFAFPRIPGALVLVVGGLISSVVLDLGAQGVALVGPVPRGLPLPQVPSIDVVSQNLPTIAISAFALLLIGFSQTAGDAQAFATRYRYRVDLNQESVAQGMANIGAGFFQGMPVSTSLSASSLNEAAGARTPVASLATGGIVVATLILLAPLFSELPKAVLAAIIIDAVVFGMIDVAEFRRLRRVKPFDFWIALAAVIGVLSVGVLLGVVVGIVLSPAVAHQRHDPTVDAAAGPGDRHARVPRSRGVPRRRGQPGHRGDPNRRWRVLRNRRGLDERIARSSHATPICTPSCSTLEGVDFVDSQGAAKLGDLHELTDANAIDLRLARVKPDVSRVLAADGVIDRIGRDRIHGNVHRAVEAAKRAQS